MKRNSTVRRARAAGIILSVTLLLLGTATENGHRPDSVRTAETTVRKMQITGRAGLPVTFSSAIFERQAGMEEGSLTAVVFTEMPPQSKGSFAIAENPVSAYQAINRSGLDRLVFRPAAGCSSAQFQVLAVAGKHGAAIRIEIRLT